jgi:DNA-binding transcriptional LysR family regulator
MLQISASASGRIQRGSDGGRGRHRRQALLAGRPVTGSGLAAGWILAGSMNLRDARYFIAAADSPSFGQAAQRCFLTQQALSAAIGRLERQIGEPLFVRHRYGVELTEAGECLLPGARELVELADRTIAAVRASGDRGDDRSGDRCLRVGVMEPAAAELTTPIMGAFRIAHPRVTVAVRELGFRGVADAVVAGQVDVALCVGPLADPRVRVTPLFHEPRAVLVSASHPLADTPSASVADVLDLTFLPGAALAPDWIGFWRLEDLRNGEPARLASPDAAEAHTPSEVNEVIAAGVGVVTGPLSHRRMFPHAGVAVVALPDARASTVAIVTPGRRATALGKAFVEVALDVSRSLIALVEGAWVAPRPA